MAIGSNLSLRITAILLIGFVLFQILIIAVMTLPSRDDAERPYNLPKSGQLRAMVETLDTAGPDRRATLIDMFNASLYTVRIQRSPPPAPRTRRKGLDILERQYEAALPGRDVDVTGRQPLVDRLLRAGALPGRFFAPIIVSVRLRNGDLLVIDSHASAAVRTYLRQRSTLGAIGGLIVLAILALAVRQTTRPLVRLSQGVRSFASDLDTPDLPVTGSREMRDLAGAFNEMKARIGGLMNERTRMLAGIAHDMRTYLTRLRLRADFIDDAEQRERAVADLTEMSALLDDTLIFAQRDAGAGGGAVLIDISRELLTLARLRQDMGEPVSLIPPGIGLMVMASPISVRRMFGNLIDNGLRHGGHVTLSVREASDHLLAEVADDGPGVPPDALERLGEPFGRIDPSRDRATGGAGLGLAIVRALADREGAQVSFANRPGGGFVVSLRFPRAA